MKRFTFLIIALALGAASCGSDPIELSYTPTTAPSTTTTTAPSVFECSGAIDNDAPLPSTDWSQAGIRDIAITIEKSQSDRPGSVESETPSTMSMVASDETGASFRWITEQTNLDVSDFPVPPSERAGLADFLENMDGITVDYVLPADGTALQVTNREEITSASTAIFAYMAEQSGDSELIDQTLGIFDAMSEENFALTIASMQNDYHSLEGINLPHTQLVEEPGLMSNPLGGASVTTEVKTVRTRRLDDDGCVSVRSVSNLDSSASLPILIDSLAAVTEASPNDPRLAPIARSVSMTKDVVTQIDPTTGIIFRQTSTKTVTLGDATETEVTTLLDVTLSG